MMVYGGPPPPQPPPAEAVQAPAAAASPAPSTSAAPASGAKRKRKSAKEKVSDDEGASGTDGARTQAQIDAKKRTKTVSYLDDDLLCFQTRSLSNVLVILVVHAKFAAISWRTRYVPCTVNILLRSYFAIGPASLPALQTISVRVHILFAYH